MISIQKNILLCLVNLVILGVLTSNAQHFNEVFRYTQFTSLKGDIDRVLVTVTNPNENPTLIVYELDERKCILKSIRDLGDRTITDTYRYGPEGFINEIRTKETERLTQYEWSDDKKVCQVYMDEGKGKTLKETLTFNPDDYLIARQKPSSGLTSYTYNATWQLLEEHREGQLLKQYVYEGDQMVKKIQHNSDSQLIQTTYQKLGDHTTQSVMKEGVLYSMSIDYKGRNSHSSTNFLFDDNGQPRHVGSTITNFDPYGNVLSVVTNRQGVENRVKYQYF